VELRLLPRKHTTYIVELPLGYEIDPRSLKKPDLGESSFVTFYDPETKSGYPGSYIETYVQRINKPFSQEAFTELTKSVSSLCGGVFEGYTTFCEPWEDKTKIVKNSTTLVYEVYFKEFVWGTKEYVGDVGPMYLIFNNSKDLNETLVFIIRNGDNEVAKEMALSVTFN